MTILLLVDSILSLINGIQITFYCLYHSLLLIGHIAISAIIEIFRIIKWMIDVTVYVCSILQEDFEYFKHDLLSLFSPVLNILRNVIVSIYIASYRAYSVIVVFCQSVKGLIKYLFNISLWPPLPYIENICILVIDSLCLIGRAFIFCIDCLRNILSIETVTGKTKKIINYIVNKIAIILRQELLFGLFIVILLTSILLKAKIHLKVVKYTRKFIFNLATALQNGIKSVLMAIPVFLAFVGRKLNNLRSYPCGLVHKKKTFSQLSKNELEQLLEQEKAEKLCVICMDRKRNIMLMHCQHLILCNVCVTALLNDNPVCPVCRKYIQDVVMVYT